MRQRCSLLERGKQRVGKRAFLARENGPQIHRHAILFNARDHRRSCPTRS